MSNGWGKAHENNTIGFGQGSDNNTIGWGGIYGSSLSGDTALGGSSIIYGLEFDGVSNSANFSYSNNAWNNCRLRVGINALNVNRRVLCAFGVKSFALGESWGIDFNDNTLRIAELDSISPIVSPTIEASVGQIVEFEFEQDNSPMTILEGSSGTVSTISQRQMNAGTNTFVYGEKGNGQFTQSVLIEGEIDGNVFNDSNNWLGLTINGATRVQSTDNGVTWNPA